MVQRVYFPLGQQGAVWTHRCCPAVSAPLHSPKKKNSLEYKGKKILYNKISSSHLGISGTEYFSEVLSLILALPFTLKSYIKTKQKKTKNNNAEICLSFRDRSEANEICCLLFCFWVQWLGCSLPLQAFPRWSAAKVLQWYLIKGGGAEMTARRSSSWLLCRFRLCLWYAETLSRSLLLGLTLKLNHQPRANAWTGKSKFPFKSVLACIAPWLKNYIQP